MKKNPWQELPLETYEAHMGLEAVAQEQALNVLMKNQLQSYPAKSVAILGVAGGNGLEYIGNGIEMVYGIDINPAYLNVCSQRYSRQLAGRLTLMEMDLSIPEATIPPVEILLADLVIEYLGIQQFCRKAVRANPRYISCVIQQDSCNGFVSESPYQEAFEKIGAIHHDIEPDELKVELRRKGYSTILESQILLPNHKKLLRIDFGRERKI